MLQSPCAKLLSPPCRVQWQNSIKVNGPKLYGPSSHLGLDNHITSRHIDPVDFRHLTAPTHQYSSNKEAAFTRVMCLNSTVLISHYFAALSYFDIFLRLALALYVDLIFCLQGDATTGWNFVTNVDPRHMKQLFSSSLAISMRNSKERTTALKHYRTPIQNSAAVAEKVKASRLEATQQVAALEAKYGKDGAAEMIRIANMHPTGIKRNHKVCNPFAEVPQPLL